MLGAIQSDSTGPGKRLAEGRNITSPSGRGREGGGGGGEKREKGQRGLETGQRGRGVGVQVGVKLVWAHVNNMHLKT